MQKNTYSQIYLTVQIVVGVCTSKRVEKDMFVEGTTNMVVHNALTILLKKMN